MRWLTSWLVVALIATPASSQPKAKEGDLKFADRTFEQWLKDVHHKDPSKRENAIRIVSMFPGPTAAKAIPVLVAELKRHQTEPVDLSVRVNICIALSNIFYNVDKIDTRTQADAVTALRQAVRDPQAILRYRAAAALAAIGAEARAATPELTAMLRDKSTWECRQAAASALASINGGNTTSGPPPVVLRSLYDLLGDNAYQVRMEAVKSIGMLGPPAGGQDSTDAYVAALLPIALKDPEPSLQIWARLAIIGATQDFKTDTISPIVKYASHADPVVRSQAVQALGMMGTKAKVGVPALIAALKDQDMTVQAAAMWAVGRMEIYAATAIPVLERIAADPNSSDFTKESAKKAIQAITPK